MVDKQIRYNMKGLHPTIIPITPILLSSGDPVVAILHQVPIHLHPR